MNDNFSCIKLTQGKACIVDPDRLEALKKFTWRAVQAKRSWYAKADIQTKNGKVTICMHRFIAQTHFGDVCHHINGNSLDNRKSNLINMSKKEHDLHHKNNKILIKYAPAAG